ncbi:BREX system P-loop protein BrxC [Oceanimonas smirnovii]|uniref:BREX system P-loop protein BrxC n=1 Tax=Oceanimonas smirnovii TaxID=264574 RepID=UPI0003679451|nr:BREX system P-loop protein BrxC [Oceanimonas smirnovii]
MLNKDIYYNDPTTHLLKNQGVAKVSDSRDAESLATLEYELKTFVCDGKYQEGIEEILSQFVSFFNSRDEQPGVWISGFFGSGKSHLAKMLAALWTNDDIDGQNARSLAELPDSTLALFNKLDDIALQTPGKHHASGTIGSAGTKNVRLAVLALLFRSLGLPEQYHLARFCVWLKQQGLLTTIQQELGAQQWRKALRNLYVAPDLHKALLKHIPDLAESPVAVGKLLASQFKLTNEISDDDLQQTFFDVLEENGEVPLTLIVMDEVQQFIGNEIDRAHDVQHVVEKLCEAPQLKSRVIFVATGQSALSSNENLQRLLGRFQLKVQLEDTDVDSVIRKVILQKKESARSAIENELNGHLGEISRHLHGTVIESHAADEQHLVADYPLLPVRRRFWDRVLHALDATGTVSQLRTQLRIVHDACKTTANKPLGNVLPADFIYDQLKTQLVQAQVISKDIHETISRKADGDATEQQQARVLALVLLIGKLPTDVDHGISATADYLADLMIEDLAGEKSTIRQQVPSLLESLVKEGLLMTFENSLGHNEYRLQTAESAQWYDHFKAERNQLTGNPNRIENMRQELMQNHVRRLVGQTRLTQGESAVSRPLISCFDSTLPVDAQDKLYVWVHNDSEKNFLHAARGATSEQATIFLYVPNKHRDDLFDAMVELKAAEQTLSTKGTPKTEAGRDAKAAMEHRMTVAQGRIDAINKDIFNGIQIKMAGGSDVEGDTPAEQLEIAGRKAIERLYPEFSKADDKKWEQVYNAARKSGGETALDLLANSSAGGLAVTEAISRYLGVGKTGKEIQQKFNNAPYGWPNDAIDGALVAMLASSQLNASINGQGVDTKTLERRDIAKATFKPEKVQLTKMQLIKVKGVLQVLGQTVQPGQEASAAHPALQAGKALAREAGGDAPLPASPAPTYLDDIMQHSGNELLAEICANQERIKADVEAWQRSKELIQQRQKDWRELRNLLPLCRGMAFYDELLQEQQAIIDNRSLLANPNPVTPLIRKAISSLRDAIVHHQSEYQREYDRCALQLEADEQWQRLAEDAQREVLQQFGITQMPELDLTNNDRVLASLENCSLGQWHDRTASLMSKFDRARAEAVRRLQPKVQVVHAPRKVINDENELKQWLADSEASIRAKLANGPVSVA